MNASSTTTFNSPYGSFELHRYPERENEPLQAYDAADGYLLREAAERHPRARSILVLGDRHGALTVALAESARVTMWSDSFLARTATAQNLERNGRRADIATQAPRESFDLVVVRPDKARSLLAAQLHDVAEQLRPGTPVILGEMVKHLGRWMTDLLEEYVGETSASLARSKARLLRAVRDDQDPAKAPQWSTYLTDDGIELHNAPGAFAFSGLDHGARLMLPELPTGLGAATVADLGCGNGVLAIASALQNPQARYLLVDESAAALESARRSWEVAFGDSREVQFVLGDGLSDVAEASVDVVLCNPPFHAGQVVDDWFGQRLLEQAHTALRPGGELLIVENRHLKHHRYLHQAFAATQIAASTPKFTVLSATR